MTLACCCYCHAEFALRQHNQKWHVECPESIEAKKQVARDKATAWKKGRRMKKGRFLREELRDHRAECGHLSKNRWWCDSCLSSKHGDALGYSLAGW